MSLYKQRVSWSSPVRVNNEGIGNGKLQIWPAIAVNETGNMAITFIDTRNTPNNSIIECYMARSSDGGSTFTNELISTVQSPTNYPGAPYGAVRFGEYIGVDYIGNRVVPVWTDERAGGFDMEIYTADIHTPIGINPMSEEIPSEFQIYQNYPNPFNPSTKIKFGIPNSELRTMNTELIIYDILGREVTTLVNEQLKPGTYEIYFDGKNYPSGVYYYKLTTGDYTGTKKMILVK